MILMADKTYKKASEIVPGDWVYTFDEDDLQSVRARVSDVGRAEAEERVFFETADAAYLTASQDHRVLVDQRGWVEVRRLRLGDRVLVYQDTGLKGWSEVTALQRLARGPVIKITVPGAHTYISSGILSHNIKNIDP